MRILIISFTVLMFAASVIPADAQYNSTAYGEYNRDTTFNRVTDWFATVGKPQREQNNIKHQRRTQRKIYRAKKRIAKKKKEFAKKRAAFRK